MIWAVAIIEGALLALCIYQIRALTHRINTSSDMVCRIVALCEKMNDQQTETAQLAKDTGEAVAILNGKVSNNEHRIRDIYKAINQMKGWPTNEVK